MSEEIIKKLEDRINRLEQENKELKYKIEALEQRYVQSIRNIERDIGQLLWLINVIEKEFKDERISD